MESRKCWSFKPEDPRLELGHPRKGPGVAAMLAIPGTERWRRESFCARSTQVGKRQVQ